MASRSTSEVRAELARLRQLRRRVRPFSLGCSNLTAIDAQCQVLDGRWDGQEDLEAIAAGAGLHERQRVLHAALDAQDWLTMPDFELPAPSEMWSGYCHSLGLAFSA